MRFICILAALLCAAASVRAAGDAEGLYQAGQRAERAGDSLHAYLLYARAAAADPENKVFAAKMKALPGKLIGQTLLGADPADETVATALEAEMFSGEELLEARQTVAPPRLKGSSEIKDFDLKGDPRTIFEKVFAAYGLEVALEAGYQAPPPFNFRVAGLGFEQALRTLEAASDSFVVPLNDRMALIVRDTAQKRTEMTPAMSIAIPIPQRMSVQDAQEMMAAVQQTLEIRRISVDPSRRVVYLRDVVSKVEAARVLFEDLSRLRAQVEVDVDFVSVEKSSTLTYGLNLQNSLSLVNLGKFLNNTPAIPSGFTQFLTFGGGASLIGLGITSAEAMATINRSAINTVLSSQIVTLDGQAATLHIGDHYPVVTTGYYGNTTGTGTVYTPPPTINFVDLGLVLKITPSVHDQGEVTLDLDAEFKALGTTSANGIPIITNRAYQGKVRLNEGEWAIIGGLVSTTDLETRSGIAGLSSIPLIGRLFSQTTKEHDSSDILVVLKPHLVTPAPWDSVPRTIWVGTESKPLTAY